MKTRSSARLAAKKNSGGAQTNYMDSAAKKKSKHAQKNYMTRAAKKKRGHVQANYIDRLSSLPDPVLQHILSFLTSRNAVQTCVVSKRWRYLWTSVPSLVLDLGEFGGNGKNCQKHLVDFVNKLLLYRDGSDVDRFHLYCNEQRCHCDMTNQRDGDYSHLLLNLYPHANKWIHYAVTRNVKELKISLYYEYVKPRFHIPKCIFTCQSLENLNLEFDTNPRGVLKSPKSIVLSQLKSLHLNVIYIHDMSKILSSCPLLEELYLQNCNFKSSFIKSDTVKSLSLIDCWTDWSPIWININIPSLTSLSLCYYDCEFPEINVGDLSSLETACVSEYRARRFRDTYAGVYLVRQLSAAEELNLSASWIKVIPKSDISQFPTLHNLKRLTLGGWQISDDFHVVALFLVHSPNLEMLTLIEDAKSEVNKDARWDAPIMFFNCPKLKTVEIRISSRNRRYLQLVDFFLANGKGLIEIIIKKSWR